MKRVISVLRDARHGGRWSSSSSAKEPSREHPYIDLRYLFEDGPARLSFPDLIVGILNCLAQPRYRRSDGSESRRLAGVRGDDRR